MKEFTVAETGEPISFKIGKDVFKAVPAERLPGNIIIRYAEQVNEGKLYIANKTFFNRVLEDESSELFHHRLDSKENPITLEVMTQVVEYLVEKYSNLSIPAS